MCVGVVLWAVFEDVVSEGVVMAAGVVAVLMLLAVPVVFASCWAVLVWGEREAFRRWGQRSRFVDVDKFAERFQAVEAERYVLPEAPMLLRPPTEERPER